jgi:hypothetical protein
VGNDAGLGLVLALTGRRRIGCAAVFLIVVIGLALALGPISRRISNSVFEKTTATVIEGLPEAERSAASERCEALWATIRSKGIPNQHLGAFKEFQKYTFTILEDHTVSEPEAREFLARAEKLDALLAGR